MSDGTVTVGDLRRQVAAFVHTRDWEQFHNVKDLAIALSIEVSELTEHFLWRAPPAPSSMAPEERDAIGDELADVVIYSLSLANALDLDLSGAVRSKLVKDEARYPPERFRGRAP